MYKIILIFLVLAVGCNLSHKEAQPKSFVSSVDNQIVGSIQNKLFSKNYSNYILVAAHRGDWRNAPENSEQSIKNCIEMGVDIVEIDVRMTKDSVLVLMHDATVDRTTTGGGKVSDLTLDELKELSLKNGCGNATRHKVPTLEEALFAAEGKILVNLDKCSGYMDKAVEILQKTGTIRQVIFKDTMNIDRILGRYGNNFLDQVIYMPVITENTSYIEGFVDDFFHGCRPVAFEVLFKSIESKTFFAIEKIRKNECRVWVNTLWASLCAGHDDDLALNHPEMNWGWVIDHGANIIQTDRPELLLKYLREKGLHE